MLCLLSRSQQFFWCGHPLYGQTREEREHMFKILKYINDRSESTKTEAIKAPPANPKNIGDFSNSILKHEIDNCKKIYEIVDLALAEKDRTTYNFGQWFVTEQIEEEALINDLIDRYTLASTNVKGNTSLHEMDRDTTPHSQEGEIPRNETI